MVKKRKKTKKTNRTKKINLMIIPFLLTLFILVFLLVYYSSEIIMAFSKEKIMEQDKTTAALVSSAKNIKENQKIKVDMTPSTTGGQGHGLYLREKDSTIDEQTNKTGPKITKGVIYPNDVVPGATQTMTIYVEDEKYEILSVIAEIGNDKDTIKKELKLKSGTKKKGVWEEKWIVKDVHKTTYNTKFVATNSKGEEGEVIVSWTDIFLRCTYDFQVWSGQTYVYTYVEAWNACRLNIYSGGKIMYGSYILVSVPNGLFSVSIGAYLVP